MRAKLGLIVLLGIMVAASGCTQSPDSGDTEMPEAEDQNNDTNQNPSTSQPADDIGNTSSQKRIVLTDSGFEPADLTVEVGETVTWVDNSDSVDMWIGSDRHPTHTQYAGSTLREHCSNGDQTTAAFDQCSTGGEFSFTFEKTGEWGYHNHERSSQGGTITVVEN